ncbi:MAG: peptide-methionine (S)-S-oxide reductase [Bacteroidetes bacterium]|nr:MAG: peptide-methionine (S)-S-oxide reductase [Bacteroidota bacterium]
MNSIIKSIITLIILAVTACQGAAVKNENMMDMMEKSGNTNLEYATLGGGCFWCIEAIFMEVRGVKSATSGYSGGTVKNPTYREVTSGKTGHAEVVQIAFNPEVISFRDILVIFFHLHDPTTLNRQGADVGTQYRSVIFYHNEDQEKTASEVFREINDTDLWADPLVTEISPMEKFYVAEDYHQNYYQNNPNQPYCTFVISPKLSKLRKLFEHKL